MYENSQTQKLHLNMWNSSANGSSKSDATTDEKSNKWVSSNCLSLFAEQIIRSGLPMVAEMR
jgi:hypothetical protein